MRYLSVLVHRERGQILMLSALLITALVGFVGLVVDGGHYYAQRRQAQNAADEAAVAAAYALRDGADATQAARDYAAANGFDNDGVSNWVTVNIPPTSGEHTGESDYVEVIVAENPRTFFIHVLLPDAGGVSARGVAGFTTGPGGVASGASIIALNDSACPALHVNANGNFTAEGVIMVNSSCGQYAGTFGCNDLCRALAGIESVGGVETDENCSPCTVTTVPHFEDPLQDVPPPCFPSSPTPCQNVGPLTVRHGSASNPQKLTDSSFDLQPGIYYGGIDIGPNSPKTMAPGIYIMAGGGFKVNPNSAFTAEEVFIYNTNDPDCPSCSDGGFGEVVINSNAAAKFSPTTSGPYAGLLFFQDRANTEKAVFNPNDAFGEGTVYFPSAHVDMNPNANMTMQVIADTIKINNNDHFIARYDANKFFQGGGASAVALVE